MIQSLISDNALSKTWKNNIFLVYWIAGPFAALLGSAASDIWLSIGALSLLACSAMSKKWQWVRQPWFLAALVFWLWLVFTAIISPWPMNALSDALPWIRFPVFAMICLLSLQADEALLKKVIWAMGIGFTIVAIIMVFERIENPDADKLYGPWNRNKKAGWYVVGIGLPVCLWFMAQAREKAIPQWFALVMLTILIGTSFNSGEIYMTLLLFLGLGTYILLSRLELKLFFSLAAISVALFAILIFVFPSIAQSFAYNLQTNLPWFPSSSYYAPWTEGIGIAQSNPLFGIGAKNFDFYCKSDEMLRIVTSPQCNSHPHQLYIQTAAEAGIIGLILFIVMGLLLFKASLGSDNLLHLPIRVAVGLTILVTVFWPISSYSEAFGQHRNFFTWYSIGIALAMANSRRFIHKSDTDQ